MAFRPALRPGAPLLRRDATHLQVGTSPGIVLRDRPGLMAMLRLLDGTRDVPLVEALMAAHDPELARQVPALLTELRSLGVVFDASSWSDRRRPGLDAEARHADLTGGEPTRLTRRASATIDLAADAGAAPLAEAVRTILVASGVRRFGGTEPDLLVVLSSGEPSRRAFEWSAELGIDHVPVVIDEAHVRIGPLVRPGLTPCVACHDHHRTDWDPAWPALLHQLGRRPTHVPPAIDALTTHAAALELATEVLAHVDGGPARAIGRCLLVGPERHQVTSWPVAFHHRCTCDLLNAA